MTIHLQMPLQWNYASLKNLLVGNNKLSVDYKKEDNKITCSIRSSEPGWKIHFITAKDAISVHVNDQLIFTNQIELKGLKNTLQYKVVKN